MYLFYRPQWIALCIPPDLILTVLEGITAIIHYCLLDPTSQYHQVRELYTKILEKLDSWHETEKKEFKITPSLLFFTYSCYLFTVGISICICTPCLHCVVHVLYLTKATVFLLVTNESGPEAPGWGSLRYPVHPSHNHVICHPAVEHPPSGRQLWQTSCCISCFNFQHQPRIYKGNITSTTLKGLVQYLLMHVHVLFWTTFRTFLSKL